VVPKHILMRLCLSARAVFSASIALFAAIPNSNAAVPRKAVVVGPAYKPCVDWFASRSPKDAPAFRALSDEIGCYDGRIDGRPPSQMVDWLSSADAPPLLVIRSPGGPVDHALPIGRMILRKRAKVTVSGICASSCANYIFSIARERVVLPDSIVLFHGGVSPATLEEAVPQMREQFRDLKQTPNEIEANIDRMRHKFGEQLAEQRELMKQAGVDPQFLERFDNIDASALAPSECTPGADRVAIFLSKQQFRQIGIQVSGSIPSSATEAASVLRILGSTDRSVCLAPAALFKSN